MFGRSRVECLACAATGLWLASLPGCMTMYPHGGYTTWKFSDPPLRSTMPVEPEAKSPAPATQPQPQLQSPEPTYSTDTATDAKAENSPQITIRQKLDAPAPGPELMAPGSTKGNARTDGALVLNVLAPTTAALGEPVQYEVRLGNQADVGLQEVVLECDFDQGLEFPSSTEQRIRRPLGTLAAGATQTIPLALTPKTAGQHCVRFRLSAKDHPAVERESCLRVADEGLTLEIVSPEQRFVGQRAEMVLTIHNRSGRALSAAKVVAKYPTAIAAREASAGVSREEGLLSWVLETLQVDERIQIQMEFECLSTAPRVCIDISVTTATANASQQTCLTIGPAAEGVLLSVADSVDPVTVGAPVVYRLEVRNASPAVLENWTIEIDVDETLALGQARVTAPASARQPQQQTEGGQLLLSGFPALAAGETLLLELPAHAVREGRTAVTATIQTPRESTVFAEPTLVNPAAKGQ